MNATLERQKIIEKCVHLYDDFFANFSEDGLNETDAQRQAISKSFEEGVKLFGVSQSWAIWRAIDAAHVKRKSGELIEPEVIDGVRTATQSWNKSSGHAFEQSFCSTMNEALSETDIRFYLQKEITAVDRHGWLKNKSRDRELISAWLKSSAFDVYVAKLNGGSGEIEVFGCVQCKTSIRDRVTRDREPSIQAMASFFWSIAVVIDGDFLKLPKFDAMVNGGTSDYPNSGWHGMYAFSNCGAKGRIHVLQNDLEPLVNHVAAAEKSFREERQWLDGNWVPE